MRAYLVITALAVATTGCGRAAEGKPSPAEPLPPVEVRATVDKAVATTGDRITYTVVVEHDPGVAVEIPEVGAQIAGLRILDSEVSPPQEVEGRVVQRRSYTLRADLVGSYVLPEVAVTYRPKADAAEAEQQPEEEATRKGEAEAKETESEKGRAPEEKRPPEPATARASRIFIEVKSVLPADGSAKDIREIKELQRPEFGLSPLAWAAVALGGLLVVGAALLLGVRWRRRRIAGAPGPPPHEIAFAALDALRSTDFDDPQAVRRYHFVLSGVLRQYVENRFGLNATDLTTEEIVGRLREIDGLHDEGRLLLRRFLVHTDEVKFAGHRPGESEIGERYDEALRFIQQTIPSQAEPGTGQADRRVA